MESIINPPVKCGYCGFFIEDFENVLQHGCLRHYDENCHVLNVDENFIVTLGLRQDPAHNSVSEESQSDAHDKDELLIQCVFARRALYDVTTPVRERTKLKKDALWMEIGNVLGEAPESMEKRWQYLRDCYIKERKKQMTYKPSGSAAGPSRKPAFRYYEQLQFLGDSLPTTQTVSNLTSPDLPECSDSGYARSSPSPTTYNIPPRIPPTASTVSDFRYARSPESILSLTPPPRTPTPGAKKRKLDETHAGFQSALLAALQTSAPQPDGVDGFLARLGEGLRRIPYRKRAALEIKMLAMVMEAEEELS